MTEEAKKRRKKGEGSFSVPRVAIDALIDAKASVYEICAYLCFARFTDESGVFSTSGITAVNSYTGANKTKGGPVDRAIQRLKTIRAKREIVSTNPKTKKQTKEMDDLGPILVDAKDWVLVTGEEPKHGPTSRGVVRYCLPGFDESPSERVWFGNNLVSGVSSTNEDGEIRTFLPLKALKNAGDVAARMLLEMYKSNDMENWGGVRPVGDGFWLWNYYAKVDADKNLYGPARLLREKHQGPVSNGSIMQRLTTNRLTTTEADAKSFWDAVSSLESAGLVYEVVMVLNRNAVTLKLDNGKEYGSIPPDAEPFCELDSRTRHGFKAEGEHGLAWATAKTAEELGYPVATEGGRFDGTYAAIVPLGYGAMIAGIYRLRFRVTNGRNAGVASTWKSIQERNDDALMLIQDTRKANKLTPLESFVPPQSDRTGADTEQSDDMYQEVDH